MPCNGYMDYDRFDTGRCDECCGCYPQMVDLNGTVIAAATGEGAPGIPVHAQIGCHQYDAVTDAMGRFALRVPRGQLVILTPELGLGVSVEPANHILYACQDRGDVNFTLSVI